MKIFYVFGDYGYVNEQELFSTESLSEARAWAQQYCAQGDLGGYNCVEVAWFAGDGEYMEELRIMAEDAEDYAKPAWDYFSD